MINFRPIQIEDKELIESYVKRSGTQNCALAFTNMFCWQNLLKGSWAIVDEKLVIRVNMDGTDKLGYMQPMCKSEGLCDYEGIIPRLAQDAHAQGDRLFITGFNDVAMQAIRAKSPNDFAFYTDPDLDDYIYSREKLSTLAGKRLQPKRNHINGFLKRFPNWEFRPLERSMFEECYALDCLWREAQGQKCSDMSHEREAVRRAFDNFESLGLLGGALFVDGKMVAFTYGSPVGEDTFCIHIEKGLTEYQGCYPMINKLFAESLPEQYTHINREEDLGLEGLRKAKLSYYPELKLVKYRAIYLHHHERECRSLWQTVFKDEDIFIDKFLITHYDERRMLRVTDRDNKYLSMLHIVPFECEFGRVAYIYGVATHPDFQGFGYATKLMKRAMQICENEGFAAVALIPAEDWLKDYYARFGFVSGPRLEFKSHDNFDFGTGDIEKNISQIFKLDKNIAIPQTLILRN